MGGPRGLGAAAVRTRALAPRVEEVAVAGLVVTCRRVVHIYRADAGDIFARHLRGTATNQHGECQENGEREEAVGVAWHSVQWRSARSIV